LNLASALNSEDAQKNDLINFRGIVQVSAALYLEPAEIAVLNGVFRTN